MVKKVKKTISKDKEEAVGSPKLSPKHSPKTSPKSSPKDPSEAHQKKDKKADKQGSQEKGADKQEKGVDKQGRKDAAAKKAQEPKKTYTEDGVKALADEAVLDIKKGIAQPASQSKGQAYIPSNWSEKYKDALGAYKKFVKRRTDKFFIVENDNGGYVVKNAGDPGTPPPTAGPSEGRGSTWKQDLVKAWMNYCLAIPKDDRSFDTFISSLPKGVRKSGGDADGGSPKLSAKKDPKGAPKDAEGSSKKKKKVKKKGAAKADE